MTVRPRATRFGLHLVGRVALVLAGVAACQAAPGPEPAAAPAVSSTKQEGTRVRGTIESIRLQNINKALGHYTFNVELVVRHDGELPPAGSAFTTVANPLTVRVDKIFWSSLPEAEREAIAPGGPDQLLSPRRWRDYAVGDTVDLEVELTSSNLAHLR